MTGRMKVGVAAAIIGVVVALALGTLPFGTRVGVDTTASCGTPLVSAVQRAPGRSTGIEAPLRVTGEEPARTAATDERLRVIECRAAAQQRLVAAAVIGWFSWLVLMFVTARGRDDVVGWSIAALAMGIGAAITGGVTLEAALNGRASGPAFLGLLVFSILTVVALLVATLINATSWKLREP